MDPQKSVEFPGSKPLPPIGTNTSESQEADKKSSGTEKSERSKRADDDRSSTSSTAFDRPGEGSARPNIIRGFRPERFSESDLEEDTLRTERTKRKTYDGREIVCVTLETQTDWDWLENAELMGTARTIGSGMGNREDPSKAAVSPKSAASKHEAPDGEGSADPSYQYQMPYSDEYGIPILDLSSDTDDSSDDEISHKKVKDRRKFIPSVGPPNILQYQRESEKHDLQAEDPLERLEEENYEKDEYGLTQGMFGGKCEFCNKQIKPFPTVEQQLQNSPESLYCCGDYREFVEFVLSATSEMEAEVNKKAKMINIKPHEHVGSKQERNAAKEKAVQRMRERELQRRQQEASGLQQNFFASGGGGGTSKAAFKHIGGVGNLTMKDMYGPDDNASTSGTTPRGAHGARGAQGASGSRDPKGASEPHGTNRASRVKGAQGGPTASTASLFVPIVARQMKTINYQLSSQKCLEEGWTLRAPSPLVDDLGDDVFIPEPLHPEMLEDGKLRERPLIEKFYESGQKFLTMFPDGTGNVFYPSGNLAILIAAVKLGQYFYTIHQDMPRSDVVAAFEPNGFGYCYFPNGTLRLYIDQYGGIELEPSGGKRRKWSWKDQIIHVHAPPFQPICIGLNRHMGVRLMSQENIALTFSANQRSCRFNMGARLKIVAPENAPLKEIEENTIFLEEKKNQVDAILDKVSNLLKFPNHPKLDKMLPPLHISSKAHKNEKLKKDRQTYLAQQSARDKKQAPVSVN